MGQAIAIYVNSQSLNVQSDIMQILIILLGTFTIIVGIIKHLTKFSIGYQLVNIPGYFIAVLGFFIMLLGALWP